jgi:hypothetical protein
MYILTIKYFNGHIVSSNHSTFNSVRADINAIDTLVYSIEVHYEAPDIADIDETSHASWGI